MGCRLRSSKFVSNSNNIHLIFSRRRIVSEQQRLYHKSRCSCLWGQIPRIASIAHVKIELDWKIIKLLRAAVVFLCRPSSMCSTLRSFRLANEIRLVSKWLQSCHTRISFLPMANQCMRWPLRWLLSFLQRSTRDASLQSYCWSLGHLLDLFSWCILFSECLWSLRPLWIHHRLA